MKILILENIRSAYNVGAMFRTADGADVSKVFLVGYTPTPLDRFGRVQSEIEKTSLGASQEIGWEQGENTASIIKQLKSEGVTVVAVEQSEESISLPDFKVPEKVAYIMGNEVEGVAEETLSFVDEVVDIPMLGMKESLNVSVAAGVILYHGIDSQK